MSVSLIERFQALFRPNAIQTPVTVENLPSRSDRMVQLFAVEHDRQSAVRDARTMYAEDTRVKRSIQELIRDVLKSGFELRVEGVRAELAESLIDALVGRIDLHSRADDWSRLTLRDGDSFLELGATTAGDIVEITRKPTLEMRRWSDEFDRFYDPMRAYYWSSTPWQSQPGSDAIYFAEWQMIHMRWDLDEGSRYGRPLFDSARKSYKRMEQGEFDIAVRRKTRAGKRYWHSMKEGGEAALQAYMTRNQEAIDDKFAAIADFYSAGDITIQTFDGDAQLEQIGDILHHADTFAIASPVPLELIGYGRNINRDVLEQKKEQYEEIIPAVQQWLEDQLLKPLFERQWLLKGIWPDSLDWSIEWKRKQSVTPAGLRELAQAMLSLKATGNFTDETLLRLFAMNVPDFDPGAELEALASRMPDEIGRMADLGSETDNAQ